jgi:hypothetical protein
LSLLESGGASSLIDGGACVVGPLLALERSQQRQGVQLEEKEQRVIYDVVVDGVGLNWEQAGPLFDRYAVTLTGRLDRRWVDCYRRFTAGSDEYARFRLDPGTSEVSFTARSTDGPVEVMGVLKKLEALVERVNREAVRAASAPSPQETPTEAAKSPVSGLAARLGFKGRGRP